MIRLISTIVVSAFPLAGVLQLQLRHRGLNYKTSLSCKTGIWPQAGDLRHVKLERLSTATLDQF